MWNNLANQYGRLDGAVLRAKIQAPVLQSLPPTDLYGLLWAYYESNGLYDDVSLALRANGNDIEAMKEFRNPANRAVAFHVSKLYPGDLPQALPLATENPAILKPIRQIWRWSNFGSKKQLLARWFACLGDGFIKVAWRTGSSSPSGAIPQRNDKGDDAKVYLQVIDPRYVTEFEADEQGHVQYIRMDIPLTEKRWHQHEPGKTSPRDQWVIEKHYWTEVWDKERVRIWSKSRGPVATVNQLGRPGKDKADRDEAHGLPFIPVVWSPFIDVGEGRGQGVFTHCLSKIDELNRIVTRLHDLIFRHDDVTWVLRSTGTDATGRPLPPPRINDETPGSSRPQDYVQLGQSRLLRLPGQSDLQSIIPSLDYNSLLSVLRDMQEELRNDLPELRYFDITAKSHVSGVALRLALGDAVDKVLEARGNLFSGLVRAHAMALTIAQRMGLPAFAVKTIGTYEQGAFDHSVSLPDVFPMTPGEKAQTLAALQQSGVPMPTACRWIGLSEEETGRLQEERIAEAKFQLKLQAMQEKQKQELQLAAAKQGQAIQLEGAAKERDAQRVVADEEKEKDRRRLDEAKDKDETRLRDRMKFQTDLDVEKQERLAKQAQQAPERTTKPRPE